MLDPGGSQSLLSAGVLGCCVVNLGGVCVAVLLRSGAVLGYGAAWDLGLCSWRCVVYFMFLVVLG